MATAGPNNPGTMADDAAVGTVAWTSVDNAKVSDNNYTYGQVGNDGDGNPTTHYLKATNFGFAIPIGSTINGIKVEFERRSLPNDTFDNSIKIVKGGVIQGTEHSVGDYWNYLDADENDDRYDSFGGTTDLWGVLWNNTDINNSNFGVVLSATGDGSSSDLRTLVDNIRITIYYTVGASSTFDAQLMVSD